MDILISIAAKIAEYTVAPIGRQAGYMIFYKGNLKELKHSIEELERVREKIIHSVEEERRNGRKIENVVQSWLGRVDEIKEQAKKLLEDPRHVNVGCSKWSLPDISSRHQLSKNAKKIARNVEMLGMEHFDRVGYLPPLEGLGMTSATRGGEKLMSRKAQKEDIILALRDPKLSKIGVYGLGGVGKTTLVKEVAKQVKDDKLFDAVVMVSISQTLDLERIQNEIADFLGLRFEEKSIVGRASRLCERIKDEKTILIILDDIWGRIDLDKLGIPSKDDHNGSKEVHNGSKDIHSGCKLLLISRCQDTLRKMESEKDFRLEVLNEQETWSLLEAVAGDDVKDASLRSIATEVAKKCAGLPILVVTVASALKGKDIHNWKDAFNQLKRVDNDEIMEIVYSALEFSYNWLGGNELKRFFLLCGVLGTSTHVNDLLYYGFGLGIFKHNNTVDDARNRLYKMISDLRASCLLLEDDRSLWVRMHDIVSEVAISIASRDQFVFVMKRNDKLEDWQTQDNFIRCTQIILDGCYIQKLPERLDCPNLKFFLLNSYDIHSLEISHSFFEGMRNLEVLDLTRMIMSSLPTSLASLTKLKTLCLYRCHLANMNGMRALKNLEILCCVHSSIEMFSNEIGQLIHLRRLDLRNSRIEVMPFNIISKLNKLEELCMNNTSFEWEVENSRKQSKSASLAEIKHLTNLTALEIQIRDARTLPRDLMFEKLERYEIVIGDKWEWPDEDYGASRLLMLKLGTSIHLEHGIKALVKRVEVLYLDEIKGISNVLHQLNGAGFPLLKHLHIQNNAEIQHIINSMERSQTCVLFPNLETLILNNLTNLEKLCHGPLTVNSFGKLRVIKVKSCEQLEYLFTVSMVKDLFQLFEIEVSDCNSIKTIVFLGTINGGVTIHKIEFLPLRSLTLQHLPAIDQFCCNELTSNIPTSFFNVEVAFPNLKTLKLTSINLKKVWGDDQLSVISSVQNLENLILEDCGGLKYLFSSFMVESLKNLEQLEISKCHMMEEIIATKSENHGATMKEVQFSKLKRIKVNDMENLKTVWHYQLERLQTLEVSKCEKLQNIFPSYCSQEAFRNIETLKVNECASVEEIFELNANGVHGEEVIAQLKNLILVGLPKMKQIWSRDPQGILSFHKLQVITVEFCSNLEYLFPFSIATDLVHLEELYIANSGVEEIVATEEGSEELRFDFPQMTILRLLRLTKLKNFYLGRHILVCPSLKTLSVSCCDALQIFGFDHLDSLEKHRVDEVNLPIRQVLFNIEKVSPNLEELTLNCNDAMRILNGHCEAHLFHSVEMLRLECFQETPLVSLNDFLKRFPKTRTLQVRYSSFKALFPSDGLDCSSTTSPGQMETLWLYKLEQLEHIWNNNSMSDFLVQKLEHLIIEECSSLLCLAPPLISFFNLITLIVEDCKGLKYLITSSTAKSLVHLRTMNVENCEMIEDIVMTHEGESEEEIIFKSLECLHFGSLPNFKCFCSGKHTFIFPSLMDLTVKECPKMQSFSGGVIIAPFLTKVEAENGKKQLKKGLNTTIKQLFLDKNKEVPEVKQEL